LLEAKVWAWVRGAAGFPSSPNEFVGHDAIVEIAGVGIKLPLSEVYPGNGTS